MFDRKDERTVRSFLDSVLEWRETQETENVKSLGVHRSKRRSKSGGWRFRERISV